MSNILMINATGNVCILGIEVSAAIFIIFFLFKFCTTYLLAELCAVIILLLIPLLIIPLRRLHLMNVLL